MLAFVLNILPVPGLDGFGVLEPYLSAPRRSSWRRRCGRGRRSCCSWCCIGLPGASAVLFGVGGALFGLIGGDIRLASAGYGELLFWR